MKWTPLLLVVVPALAAGEGTSTNISGFLDFFRELETSRALTQERIARLGAAAYKDRSAAFQALRNQPFVFGDLLDEAKRSTDPEIRVQALALAERVERRNRDRLRSALLGLREGDARPGIGMLLRLFPEAEGCRLTRTARTLLFESARASDAPALRDALASGDEHLRATCCELLGRVGGDGAVATLRDGLGDPSERVRLGAGVGLLNRRDASGLPALLELTRAEDRDIAWQALSILGTVAGTDGTTNTAGRGWEAWIAGDGQAADWALPVRLPPVGARPFNGRDFTGWVCFVDGDEVAVADYWDCEGGAMRYNGERGGRNGYLRTREQFVDYTVLVEWRWLHDGERANDSGVYVAMTRDGLWPVACEANLAEGDAGQCWFPGGFPATVDGEDVYKTPRIGGAASERPVGEWNRMEVRVERTGIEVFVNDVLQNRCRSDLSKPSHIGFQMEKSKVAFRNLVVIPNE